MRQVRTGVTAIVERLDDLLRVARERLPEPTKDEPTPEEHIWVLPEEPPVGTRLIDCEGDIWKRGRDGWRWLLCESGWSEVESAWRYVLAYGPLREATPDDLARLGIEDGA